MIRTLKSHLIARLRVVSSFGCLAIGEPFFRLLGMRRGKVLPELSEVQQILILRLDQIGDVVMTTPLLRELRRNAPQAHITLVVKTELRELMSACPYVDELLIFDWHMPSRFLEFQRRGRALKFCFTHLWRRRFDLAIIPRWDADWYCQIFLAYFSGARWRIAYSEDVNPIKQVHNRGYDHLLTHALHQDALHHEVERSLKILRELGGEARQTHTEIWLTPAEDFWAQKWLENKKIRENQPLLAFGPFVGNSSLKRWPLPNFAALGRWLVKGHGGNILIFGGAGDQEQAQAVCEKIGAGAWNLAGQTSLPQTAALLKRCTLYVGDDSGPMHLASAVGIPVVALFGPSCPHRFGPWNPKKKILWKELPCSPCQAKKHADCCTVCIFAEPQCIQSITVKEVQSAIEHFGLFAGFSPPPAPETNRVN